MPSYDQDSEQIIAMERAAMERWGKGDPDGFLEICDPSVTYFDPFQHRRMDGREALAILYATLRGKVKIDRCEFVTPRVQVCGDAAVLTYNFDSWGNESHMHWHATEVYQRTEAGWRIVHTHWSLPRKKADAR